MKKSITILAITLLSFCMVISAYAQIEPVEEIILQEVVPDYTELEASGVLPWASANEEEEHPPRVYTGRGTIEAIDEYWTINGFPDNISFARKERAPIAPGEIIPDGGERIFWWIGIINANDESRQEIIGLLSPNSLITFVDSKYSFDQRMVAFNDISASVGDTILNVVMAQSSDTVWVYVAERHHMDEYQSKFSEQYGTFVRVTIESEEILDEQGVLNGIASIGMDGNNFWWLWLLVFVFAIAMGMVVFFNRVRFIPALQTNRGNVITESVPLTRGQVISAVKNSAVTPPESSFASIMETINISKESTD